MYGFTLAISCSVKTLNISSKFVKYIDVRPFEAVTDIFETPTQWSSTCYFEEQISITATEWLTSLLDIVSVRCKSVEYFNF